MRFYILGPLSIGDGAQRRLSAAKHRSLLAVLLINANQVVSIERLVDELWAEDPPVTAQNLVRQYVSHLRKLLTPGHLHTHASGYLLQVGRGSRDIEEFEHLVHDARAQLAAGRAAQAKDTVARALLLWRGAAFADVPGGPSVTAERVRLDELHAGAQELAAEAGLAAGLVAEAVSELTALTVRYPLRERLYVLLMRALSLSGRKADALAVYRGARGILVTEVGLEPGPELRQMEQAILADELPGPRPEHPRGGEATVAPAQLPAALPDYVERRAVAAEMHRLVTAPADENAPLVVALSGLGGVGKTSLVVRLGHRLQSAFPHGQLFVRLTGAQRAGVEPVDALGRILDLLGHQPAEQPAGLLARQDLYRSIMATRRVLLILDDALSAAQVRQLLPGRTAGAVLITSRSRLAALDGARHVTLPAFTADEAVRLLAGLVGAERTAAEPEAAHAIAAACGHLPLAVRVAGALASSLPHRSLRHLALRLDGDRALDELVVGDLSVLDVVAGIYADLDATDRAVLRELACRHAASDPTGGTLSEQAVTGSRHAIDRLVESGILEVVGSDRDGWSLLRCSELLCRYARRLAAVPPAVVTLPGRARPARLGLAG